MKVRIRLELIDPPMFGIDMVGFAWSTLRQQREIIERQNPGYRGIIEIADNSDGQGFDELEWDRPGATCEGCETVAIEAPDDWRCDPECGSWFCADCIAKHEANK